MLDPTLSEAVILRSVKKFFVDAFPSYPLFFGSVDRQPKDGDGNTLPVWLCILPSRRFQDTLAYADIQIHMFVEGAANGEASAQLRDEVLEHLYDFEQTDGCKRMVCYDTDWSPVFTARMQVLGDSDYSPYMDGLCLKIIPFRLHWGAK